MPGWHDKTRELRTQGKLQMLGIVQEQHPDRARLFMQWKNMDWPLLVDPLNQLGVRVVPITLAIDENGIIRLINPKLEELKESFLDREFEAPVRPVPAAVTVVPEPTHIADKLLLWGADHRLDAAVAAYGAVLKEQPEHAAGWFRLGVALRMRYDSTQRRNDDFLLAVEAWSKALELDPNNYIWRRRIQQYGPRLDKPYPFYDWVAAAREGIQKRGETPIKLSVEPRGAELAGHKDSFEQKHPDRKEPDPKGEIKRDKRPFVNLETVVVPPVLSKGQAARVHLIFTPNKAVDAHWNNEAEDLLLWVVPPAGWQVDQQAHTVANGAGAISLEERRIELELRAPEAAVPGEMIVPAYVLYYVCEGVDGTCLYRRRDLRIGLRVAGAGGGAGAGAGRK